MTAGIGSNNQVLSPFSCLRDVLHTIILIENNTNRGESGSMSLRRDIATVFERDPAARSLWEVLICYPGLHALYLHRMAHWLYRRRWFFLARLVSHFNRLVTAIEIHPGAQIGPGFFIDHGAGVVIGETTIIGEDVTIYQGVVLGGTGKEKGKRHPTIGDRVVISAGAMVLGNISIEEDCKIGAGAVVINSVPPGCTVVGVPGQVVKQDGDRVFNLDHGDLPDPVEARLRQLEARLRQLERMNQE